MDREALAEIDRELERMSHYGDTLNQDGLIIKALRRLVAILAAPAPEQAAPPADIAEAITGERFACRQAALPAAAEAVPDVGEAFTRWVAQWPGLRKFPAVTAFTEGWNAALATARPAAQAVGKADKLARLHAATDWFKSGESYLKHDGSFQAGWEAARRHYARLVTAEMVELCQCPPGLFLFEGMLGFRSEYSTEVHGRYQADAYVVETGEYFWGGTKGDVAARDRLMVQPVGYDMLTAALSARQEGGA